MLEGLLGVLQEDVCNLTILTGDAAEILVVSRLLSSLGCGNCLLAEFRFRPLQLLQKVPNGSSHLIGVRFWRTLQTGHSLGVASAVIF